MAQTTDFAVELDRWSEPAPQAQRLCTLLAEHPGECQRRQVGRSVCAAERRTYKVPSTVEILANARTQRERRNGGGTTPGPFATWSPTKRPTEDELLRRLFPPRQVRMPRRRDRARLKQFERFRSLTHPQYPVTHQQDLTRQPNESTPTQKGSSS